MKPWPACGKELSKTPIYWTRVSYLRPASRLFGAARCNMPKHEGSATSPLGWRNSRSVTASAFDRTRVGSNSLPDPSLDVSHYVAGSTVAYGRIPSQNHRVETIGAGELFDG